MCTWVGDTAAAGADRTGIPLRGLLGVGWISTVCPGPSGSHKVYTSVWDSVLGGKTTLKLFVTLHHGLYLTCDTLCVNVLRDLTPQ